MNRRLAWNFEIDSSSPFMLPKPVSEPETSLRWESRFFWPESQIITLLGLETEFLELSRYNIKHRADTYLLLPDENLNFKIRREALFYKPLIEKTAIANAYGKKIKLDHNNSPLIILKNGPKDPDLLIKHIQTHGQSTQVEKEALIYKFPSHPATKLELARLVIHSNVYFSVSIESADLALVKQLTEHMIPNQVSSDYVTFLKKIVL